MIIIDASGLKQLEKQLNGIPKGVPKVLRRTLGETVKRSKKGIAETIQSEYTLKKSGDIKKAISSQDLSVDNTGAEVTLVVKSGAAPLKDFKHSPAKMTFGRGKVLTASVKNGQGGPIPSAFKTGMRSGHIGIYKRVGGRFMAKTNVKGPYKGMQTRQAIDELFGPSIAAMASSDTSRPKIEKIIKDTFDKRLDHNIDYLLSKD